MKFDWGKLEIKLNRERKKQYRNLGEEIAELGQKLAKLEKEKMISGKEKTPIMKKGFIVDTRLLTKQAENPRVVSEIKKAQKRLNELIDKKNKLRSIIKKWGLARKYTAEKKLEPKAIIPAYIWKMISKKLFCFDHLWDEGEKTITGAIKSSKILGFLNAGVWLAALIMGLIICSVTNSSGYYYWWLIFSSSSLFCLTLWRHGIGDYGDHDNLAGRDGPTTWLGGLASVVLFGFVAIMFLIKHWSSETFFLLLLAQVALIAASFWGVKHFFFWCNKNIWPHLLPVTVLLSYWPEKNDYSPLGAEQKVQVTFRVKPSKNFIKNMEKLETADVDYSIAATPRAIMVDKDPDSAQGSTTQDPILFSAYEDNVIIYDQIGNFADEIIIMREALDAFNEMLQSE